MHELPLDDETVDRVLSGRVLADDAPPGYAGVVALLRAVAGPAATCERRLEAEVVREAAAHATAGTGRLAKEKPTRRLRLPIRVAAASAVGTLGFATVAAAVGVHLAGEHGPTTRHPAGASTLQPRSDTGSTSTALRGSTAPGESPSATAPGGLPSATPVGPVQGMKLGNATFGLCTAFLHALHAAQTASTGSATSPKGPAASPAFRGLMTAGGGTVTSTKGYCTTYLSTHTNGSPASRPGATTHLDATTHPAATHPGASGHPSAATHPGASGHPSEATHPGASGTTPSGASHPAGLTGTMPPAAGTHT